MADVKLRIYKSDNPNRLGLWVVYNPWSDVMRYVYLPTFNTARSYVIELLGMVRIGVDR